MQVWIIMCFVPRRRAVCQEEVEKQLFAFAITSKPHERPMQHLKEVLFYMCLLKQHLNYMLWHVCLISPAAAADPRSAAAAAAI